MIEAIVILLFIIGLLVMFIMTQRGKIKALKVANVQLEKQNQAQKQEINNAKERKQVQHTINQLNQSDVDKRLHDQGYYRD